MANIENFDDYSTSRVTLEGKKPMWQITVVRLGGFACVPQLLLGATLGYSLSFKDAFIALLFGSVILQIVAYLVGAAGSREGLSTSLLTRWTGFGKVGSSLISLTLFISLLGWFGVQNGIFAEGMKATIGIFNVQTWAVITGVSVVLIVTVGIKLIGWISNIALPAFAIIVVYAFFVVIRGNDMGDLIASAPAGPPIPMSIAITMVAGSAILGAIINPDVTRFLKKSSDVFWMTLISTFVGELGFGLLAVLMAHAVIYMVWV